jgi:hypothetical protein
MSGRYVGYFEAFRSIPRLGVVYSQWHDGMFADNKQNAPVDLLCKRLRKARVMRLASSDISILRMKLLWWFSVFSSVDPAVR